jgi:uncharacterized membrane protein HdeD (DUF308 family)
MNELGGAAAGKNMKLFGITMIILGALSIAAPMITGLSIALLVGLLVVAGGILRMVWAFQAGGLGRGLLMFAIGGLTLLCGIALVTDPLLASGVLTIMLAAYLLIDGAFEIAAAFKLQPRSGWGWLLVGGIVSILLGLMIWSQFPLSGAWAIGILLGFKLLLVGMTMIGVGSAVQSATPE